MARVHFGTWDLLRSEIPPEMLDVFRSLLERAASGEFEPWHGILFEVGRRGQDPVAALFRFALWQGVRLNLLVAAWGTPECQALGLLGEEELASEVMLKEMLSYPEDLLEDTRPLRIMVAEALARTDAKLRVRWRNAVAEYGEEFQRLLEHIESIELARELSAREAAIVDPCGLEGDQQIVDAFPNHFATTGALKTARHRLKGRRRECGSLRLIDLFQEASV